MNEKIIWWVVAVIIVVGAVVWFQKGPQPTVGENMMGEHQDTLAEYEISPSAVVEKMNNGEGIVLLDVRTPSEYEETHLKGAILLPVQELSAQTLAKAGLGEDAKDKEIILYCRSGARSKTAYDIMTSLGYTNVKSVGGGMVHWEEDRYPFTEAGAYSGQAMMIGGADEVSLNGPKIALSKTFYDFGVVPQYGGVVKTTFTIQNTGNETLTLGDITTSCSCTSAEVSSKTIATSGSAELVVTFDPNFHAEPIDVFKRTVFIQTNDPVTPEVEVVVQVDIAEGK